MTQEVKVKMHELEIGRIQARYSLGCALATSMHQRRLTAAKLGRLLQWSPTIIENILRCHAPTCNSISCDDVADLFLVMGYGAHVVFRALPETAARKPKPSRRKAVLP